MITVYYCIKCEKKLKKISLIGGVATFKMCYCDNLDCERVGLYTNRAIPREEFDPSEPMPQPDWFKKMYEPLMELNGSNY